MDRKKTGMTILCITNYPGVHRQILCSCTFCQNLQKKGKTVKASVRILSLHGKLFLFFILMSAHFLSSGCSCAPVVPSPVHAVYSAGGPVENDNALYVRFAPVFLIQHADKRYNQIGSPKAKINEKQDETIYIDPAQPVIYCRTQEFRTGSGKYTNLVYRVHFPEVPFSLFPFHLTAGKNVGLIYVVTLDEKKAPLLITLVHTCGCYKAFVPTSVLPETAFPPGREEKTQNVYGETLPAEISYDNPDEKRILLHIRSGTHRIMDLETVPAREKLPFPSIVSVIAPMDRLFSIPLEKTGKTTSFYHETGPAKGFVKGSHKPWETIFMTVLSLDPLIGTDKIYTDNKQWGNPFYTSLKPWARQESDMWDFAGFLKYWGWNF